MFGAEVEHLLGLGDAADVVAGQNFAAADQAAHVHAQLLRRQADDGHDAARFQQLQVVVERVVRGDGGQNEVEFAAVVVKELLVLAGGEHAAGAELVRFLLLAQ